jgi:hypothetical protein
MALYTVVVNSADGNVPWISGDTKGSLQRLQNHLKKLAGGLTSPGTNTVQVKQTAVAALAVVTCAAVAAADTVTINGTALTATQHNATGTATFSTIVAGNVVTVNGVAFTARAAASTQYEFTLGASDTTAAAALAAAINACVDALITGVVTATSAAGVVTVRAVTGGTGGNAITLAKTGAPVAVSGATLANGATVASNQFDYKGSDTETGTALVNALAASGTSLVSGHVTGVNVAGAVTISARVPGVSGNAITIATSNGTRLAITGSLSRLGGGSETALSYTF